MDRPGKGHRLGYGPTDALQRGLSELVRFDWTNFQGTTVAPAAGIRYPFPLLRHVGALFVRLRFLTDDWLNIKFLTLPAAAPDYTVTLVDVNGEKFADNIPAARLAGFGGRRGYVPPLTFAPRRLDARACSIGTMRNAPIGVGAVELVYLRTDEGNV